MSGAMEILRLARVEVAPETFVMASLSHGDYQNLLGNPELSPRAESPFMLLKDKYEVTLLLDALDWQTMRHAARNARIEDGFRLLTFNVELDWTVIGFLAEVARILAAAEIPIGAFSAFSRDHLLVKQEHLAKALKVLGEHVAELC
jgi:uncharacterized protein